MGAALKETTGRASEESCVNWEGRKRGGGGLALLLSSSLFLQFLLVVYFLFSRSPASLCIALFCASVRRNGVVGVWVAQAHIIAQPQPLSMVTCTSFVLGFVAIYLV